MTNSGSILTSGNSAHGFNTESNNTVRNTGLISTTGLGADGIDVSSNNTIFNSGTIIVTAPNSFSVDLRNFENTLNLLQDSLIVGLIRDRFRDNTTNFGRGENWLISFDSGGGPPDNFNTFGVPTAILNGGLTIATFDPATTIFGHEDDALSDFLNEVRGGLDHRLTSGNPTTYLWAHGFGGFRNGGDFEGGARLIRDPATFRKTEVEEQEFAGVMAGFSAQFTDLLRGGLFVGAGESDIRSERARSIGDNSWRHEIEADDIFGGLYARTFWGGGAFADLIVTGGTTDRNTRRRILNNTVATGVEFAVADYDGWYVSPELTVGVEVPVARGSSLVPSASVGYTNLTLDGFTETGSVAAVSFGKRNIETVDGRLQLELRSQIEEAFRASIRGGVKARSSSGDDELTGVLAGTTAFTAKTDGTDDDAVAAFAGADLTWTPFANTQFYAGGEIAFEDDSRVIAGRLGGALKF